MSDLDAALDALQLGHFLPKLRQLGVDNLSQVAHLLTSDLAEVGLNRVQIRQLQKLAGSSGAILKESPSSDASTPPWSERTKFFPPPREGPFQMSPRRKSDAGAEAAAAAAAVAAARRASHDGIYKPVLEGSPQMTEMNAQEKLLLKQLGQRFQLASERTAAIVWDAPAMMHLQGEELRELDMADDFSEAFPEKMMGAPSAISAAPDDGDVPATFYRLDFGDSPSVQQQMPEALRKRLENRKEQLVQQKKTQEKGPEKGDKNDRFDKKEAGPTAVATPTAAVAAPAARSSRSRGDEIPTVPPLNLESSPAKVRSSSIGLTARRTSREDGAKRQGSSPTDKPNDGKVTNQGQGRKAEEGGRQMFDKNTLRMMHREVFKGAIGRYQQRMLEWLERGQSAALSARTPRRRAKSVQVFVRVRPIFDRDIEKGDFDVISVVPGQLVLHSCHFEADLKSPFISHHSFQFDQTFGHTASNKRVYKHAAAEIVQAACDGGVGTIFMFGQTGSGKTHTMCAIEEMATQEVFAQLPMEEDDDPMIGIQFLELRGDKCFDLLANTKGRDFPELRLREHQGTYRAEGAMELYPRDTDDMRVVLETGHVRRKTSATGANAVSSRSHAVCIIRLFKTGGMLVLVDCAGSERKKDSMYHTKERQQESAEINTSLSSLKDCIRSLSSQPKVPSHVYRTSSLTKVLADAFICGDRGRLAVICTASPCATDTEHTISTLRLGATLAGFADTEEKEPLMDLLREHRGPPETHPNQWNPDQVRAWIAEVQNGDFAEILGSLPSNTTGQMLVRFTESRCVQLCGGNARRGQLFFKLLHNVMQRVDASRRQCVKGHSMLRSTSADRYGGGLQPQKASQL